MRRYVTVFLMGLVLLSIGFLLGLEIKPNRTHPYLPPLCSDPYIPTSTEWKSLHMTAVYNRVQGLTDKFVQTYFTCYPYPEWYQIVLDLVCQSTWNHYLGNGAFDVSEDEARSALMEAVKTIMDRIHTTMPNVSDDVVKMEIYIKGFPLAVYEKGRLNFKENISFKKGGS